ncbi:MAG: RDD family protein, partial [Chloroflexia bacterium]
MDKVPGHVAQVFVWKQGAAPDIDYARQVLSVASPEAFQVMGSDASLLQLFSVMGEWSEDPWERAMGDIRAIPAPEGTRWTDTSRYLLKGWQGTDSRSGDKIFVVVAYRRAVTVPETFRGEAIDTPAYEPPPGAQPPPYYGQYATGPLVWPPQQQQGQASQPYVYPSYSGASYGQQQGQSAYPYGYNPLATAPPGPSNLPVLVPPPEIPLPDSYAPYYGGFGTRLAATLIDIFFMSWFFAAILVLSAVLWGLTGQTGNLFDWFRSYACAFALLGVVLLVVYELTGWSTSGRTWGKQLMGLRVVKADGGTPGFGRAMLRMLGYFFSLSIAGWGFMMILLDPRRQGLHDKIAETFVVPDRPRAAVPMGLPGYRTVAGALPAPGASTPAPMLYPPPEAAQPSPVSLGRVGSSQYQVPSTEYRVSSTEHLPAES